MMRCSGKKGKTHIHSHISKTEESKFRHYVRHYQPFHTYPFIHIFRWILFILHSSSTNEYFPPYIHTNTHTTPFLVSLTLYPAFHFFILQFPLFFLILFSIFSLYSSSTFSSSLYSIHSCIRQKSIDLCE